MYFQILVIKVLQMSLTQRVEQATPFAQQTTVHFNTSFNEIYIIITDRVQSTHHFPVYYMAPEKTNILIQFSKCQK